MNRRLFYILSIGVLLGTVFASAQPRGRLPPNLQTPSQLEPGTGDEVLARFRSVGPAGDLLFNFELTHQPYRGDTIRYTGRLAGSWSTGRPQTRVDLPASEQHSALRLLLWNGPQPQLWQAEVSGSEDVAVQRIGGDALFEPLVANVTFSPFELQMPFIYWQDYAYEGTRRVKGRPAHYFLLYPPVDDPNYAHLGGVRAVIDADFNVILRAETLDLEGNTLKTINVQGFKRVNGQWIVQRIDLVDTQTRDRTRFEVTAAAVGLSLDPALFQPEALQQAFPDDYLLDAL